VARALDVVFDDRLALLSNIPEELASHYENHHSRLEMFQVRGFSCRIGHAKPDPAAFRWCLDALAVPADQVVFVDDREENIQAAQTIGMRCHLFTTPARVRELLAANYERVYPGAMIRT